MRFRALIVVAVLCARGASADWASTSINVGTPYDVEILDAGVFIVTGATNAQLVSCTQAGSCATVDTLNVSGLAGAELNAQSCMWGVTKTNATVVGNAACSYGMTVDLSQGAQRLRCLPSGFCAATTVSGGTNARIYSVETPGPGPWASFQGLAAGTTTPFGLSLADLNGVIYSAAFTGVRPMYLSVDAGVAPFVPVPSGNIATDGKLFGRRDGGLGVFLTRPNAPTELFGQDLTVGTTDDAGWVQPTVSAAVGGLAYVAYSETAGSSLGFGFGVASPTGGGSQLAGPVPNPSRPGLDWIARTATLPGPNVNGVYCFDPSFCVITLNTAALPNVFVYWNQFPPALSFQPGGYNVAEGGNTMVTVPPSDGDGDPVFVNWDNDGGPVTVVPSFSPDPRGGEATVFVGLFPGSACSATYPLTAWLSDGYAPHDHQVATTVNVQRQSPDAPNINPPDASFAGLGPVALTGWTDGGCAGTYGWSLLSDAGTLTPLSDGGALYTPPAYFCQPSGSATVGLTASFVGMASTTANVPIVPWGVPNVPGFLDASPAMQDAGTDIFYPLGPSVHFCQDAGGFPGLTVTWSFNDAGPGIGITTSDVGVDVCSADSCGPGGNIDFSVVYDVRDDDAGRVSGPGALQVTVVSALQPVSPGQYGFSMNLDAGAASAGGVFTVNVPCVPERGLEASVAITKIDGGVVGDAGPWPVSHDWFTPLQGGCAGGVFTVEATLVANGAVVGKQDGGFSLPVGIVGVGDLSAHTLDVSCEGIDQTISVADLPPPLCPLAGAIVKWTQSAGPPIQIFPDNAPKVRLTSANPGLDGLVGETLSFNVQADNGAGQTADGGGSILLTHTFVDVTHDMGPAESNADALTTVRVTVHNRETCRVQNVVLKETPRGLSYVPDSARADRDVVPATLTGGELDIGPFTLEPNQTRVVSYLARAALLSTPQATGRAWIKAADVTTPSSATQAPASCGCDSSVPALVLLLAAFSLWPRRRALSPLRTSRCSASRTRPSRTGAPGSP
jgi:hypothetical protein